MLDKIISFSVNNKLIILILLLAFITYGAYEVTKLPIDAVPDITDNQVQIITSSPSLGVPDVERLITFPIEQANANIAGLKEIRSFSRFGLSVVTIVFEDNIDVYWARQQVAERLHEAQELIPKGVGSPKLAPITTGLGEIYQYVVRVKKGYEGKYTPMELRSIQDWIIRRQLRDVKGVADVSSFGGYLKQYEVAVKTDRLKAYNISIADVLKAVEANNENTGGAYIEKLATVQFIRAEGLVKTMQDIENIPIKKLDNGVPLLLRDVAEVQLGHAIRYGAMSYNGEAEVAGAVVMMLKGANSNEVIKSVKQRIALIQKTLPEGVVIEPFLDRTKMVENAIGTVEKNLIEGALIVLFVLILFLGNVRAGVLVASVIPLAMMFAVIMMNTFGVSGNLMSLGAIDFGLVVDGTVIIVEAVLHQMHHNPKLFYSRKEMDVLVNETSARMRNAAVFGEIIIFIVYIPIFSLQGIEGKMFKPMAFTVAFALLGAFMLSLTYVPMMSSLFLSRKVDKKPSVSDKLLAKMQLFYTPLLNKTLNYPKTIIALTLIVIGIAFTVMQFLGGEFIPKLEEGDFAVETRTLSGSNIPTSLNAIKQSASILKAQFPEIEKVVGKIGSSEIPTDPMPIDASDMIIVLKDKKEWTSARTFNELTQKMSTALEAVPGVNFSFQYPVQMRFNELMTGARQDVVCKIYGEDLDTLAAYAQKLGTIINTVHGAADLYVESVSGVPQIQIDYDRRQMASYGLNIADVNKIVNTAFAGQSTGLVYEGEKRFDLVVRLSQTERTDIEDVRNLLIATPQNLQIPLRQVAKIELKESAIQIQRENAQRRIIVGFNVRGRDVESIVKELQQKVDNKLQLPYGYHVTYGGSFENLEAAKKRLSIAIPISLVLIFLMLYFAIGSFKQALLIYSTIPIAAVGGIFALALRGLPFSISAGVGFIALFGVAVLNGIVLIVEFNSLQKEGLTNLKQIVIEGTKKRLRPVLITAAVASLGFLPMAISNGAGAEVQRPLATVVIGGLVSATLLTLFVLPLLYTFFSHSRKAPIAPVAASLILLLAMCVPANAQVLPLQNAIDSALKNNLTLQNNRLNTRYYEALTRTAWNIPPTTIGSEYGHINSAYNDYKIGISQTVSLPNVYTRHKEMLHAEWQAGQLNTAVKETELKRHVSLVYLQLAWLMKKVALLKESSQIFTEFYRKAELKYTKGETNIVEKAVAEMQLNEVEKQLTLAQSDLAQTQLQLKYLLNSTIDYLPDTNILNNNITLHTPLPITQHPYLQYLEQQQRTIAKEYRWEQSKLLPEITAGVYNQSFKGWQRIGNEDVFYDATKRFNALQAGIALPLFGGAQQAKLSAIKINETIVKNNYTIALNQYSTRYNSLTIDYTARLKVVAYYKQTGLPNASLIIEKASLQYQGGDISYQQYALLINQALTIKNEYLDQAYELNKVIVELNNY